MIATGANPGLDLVLIARPATVDRPFDELRRDLQQSLQMRQHPVMHPLDRACRCGFHGLRQ